MDRKLQQYVLFCAGMGSSTAWWLIMSTNLAEKASYGQNTTLVLHVCYFVVLLVCSLAYRRIEPHLRRAGVIGGLSALTAASLVPALLVVMGLLDTALYVPCIAVAAVAKALIFLAWMMAFSDILNPRSGIVLMLAAMTIGWMLCLVVAMADTVVAAVATCLLVLVSGGCLIALTTLSGPRTVPAEPEPAGGASPLSLLPPLFLAGLMLYEFAPGFVTGSIQAASDSEALMSTYAATALLLAASLGATTLLMHFEAGKRYVTRFVVPFIAVGLLLVALLGPGEQTIAFACIITGTSVFDAFVYSSFAQRIQRTGVSALRLFAWGQFVIQVAILVAFVLGLALAGHDSTWITTVCLVLVSLIILGGRFDLHGAEKDPISAAASVPDSAHANPGQGAGSQEDERSTSGVRLRGVRKAAWILRPRGRDPQPGGVRVQRPRHRRAALHRAQHRQDAPRPPVPQGRRRRSPGASAEARGIQQRFRFALRPLRRRFFGTPREPPLATRATRERFRGRPRSLPPPSPSFSLLTRNNARHPPNRRMPRGAVSAKILPLRGCPSFRFPP